MSLWDNLDLDWITAIPTRKPGTDRVLYEGDPWEDFLEHREGTAAAAEYRKDAEELYSKPHPVKMGPMEFTTAKSLVRWPLIIWDVNGYYASLGISPFATKREIKEAYQRLNGHESERLTYIVKQLLNEDIRRAYDACQPNSKFFDKYEAEYVRQVALDEHRRAHGRSLDIKEQREQGESPLNLEQFLNTEIDLDKGAAETYDNKRFRWGFYLWRAGEYDFPKLLAWQRYLCVASTDTEKLSIGLMGGADEPTKLIRIGFYRVAFLNINTEPTLQLAQSLLQEISRD